MRKGYLFLIFLLFVMTTRCANPNSMQNTAIEPKETSNINEPASSFLGTYALPGYGDIYNTTIIKLIGTVVFIPPGENPTPSVVDSIIKLNVLKNDVTQSIKDEVVYSSKVNKEMGGNLTFLIGQVNLADKHIYDITLKVDDIATITPRLNYIDQSALNNIWRFIPKRYNHAIFVTGVEDVTLAIRDFKEINSDANASYSLIKVGGKYYTSNETTMLKHIIFIVGPDVSERFGTQLTDGVYIKTENPLNLERLKTTEIREYRAPVGTEEEEVEANMAFGNENPPSLEEAKIIQRAFLKIKPSQLKK